MFTWFFLTLLLIVTSTQYWLMLRQQRNILLHRHRVPDAFQDTISLDDHQKAADYSIAKLKHNAIDLAIGTIMLLALTIGGGITWLDTQWQQVALAPLLNAMAVLISVFTLFWLIDLPSRIYKTFVIEERFGFNNTNALQFSRDLALETILAALIGLPLLALILWLIPEKLISEQPITDANSLWWFAVWLTWTSFTLLLQWLYPTVIAPLFNHFTPLADGTLKQSIETLLKQCGFTSQGIFVIDGSRRSGHGNAYFSGLGRNKRIVFYDTLLNTLNDDETIAVLAHELGHFHHRHIHKRMISMAVISLGLLALMAWLASQLWFYQGLGVSNASNYNALLLFILTLPVATFMLNPLGQMISRRHEFEADHFAATTSEARFLIQALIKLYQDNANTLTPDRLYSAFHDSHPPASIRIARLSDRMGGQNR